MWSLVEVFRRKICLNLDLCLCNCCGWWSSTRCSGWSGRGEEVTRSISGLGAAGRVFLWGLDGADWTGAATAAAVVAAGFRRTVL